MIGIDFIVAVAVVVPVEGDAAVVHVGAFEFNSRTVVGRAESKYGLVARRGEVYCAIIYAESLGGDIDFVLSMEYDGHGFCVVVGVVVVCFACATVDGDGHYQVADTVVFKDGGEWYAVPSVAHGKDTYIDKL